MHLSASTQMLQKLLPNSLFGVIFNQKLTWKYHLDMISSYLSSAICIIAICTLYLNKRWLMTLQNTLFSSF